MKHVAPGTGSYQQGQHVRFYVWLLLTRTFFGFLDLCALVKETILQRKLESPKKAP